MFTGEMFAETLEMKRQGLRGKKLARAMAKKFPSYSAEELEILAENVPSPELRSRAKVLHVVLLTLLGMGSIAAAISVATSRSESERLQALVSAAVLLLLRAIPIFLIARHRRDGALVVFFGACIGISRIGSLHLLDVVYMVVVVVVAFLWTARLFPNLTWRGRPRSSNIAT